jgi:hypothetical protein
MGIQPHLLYRKTFFSDQALDHERVDCGRRRMAIGAVDVVCAGGTTAHAGTELSDDDPSPVEWAAVD